MLRTINLTDTSTVGLGAQPATRHGVAYQEFGIMIIYSRSRCRVRLRAPNVPSSSETARSETVAAARDLDVLEWCAAQGRSDCARRM